MKQNAMSEVKKSGAGFTLIEVLIYLALFAMVIGGGMVATYQIIQSTAAGSNHVILQEEANFLLRKVDWALTGASGITASGSTLTLTKTISGAPTALTFAYIHPNLTLKQGTGSTLALNSSDISIDSLSFSPTSSGNGVVTTFTLTTAVGGKPASETFSTTKYPRQ